jgi:hypothetical protein
LFAQEAGLPIIPTLDHMLRETCQIKMRLAWHAILGLRAWVGILFVLGRLDECAMRAQLAIQNFCKLLIAQ